MKKLVAVLGIILIIFCDLNAQTKKVSGPVFLVYSADILCCSSIKYTKKVHVVSSANWSVFTNIGLRIEDNSGNVIATYLNITGDFTTPCLNITNGQTYKVFFTNSLGDFPVTRTIIAPSCGHIRVAPVGKDKVIIKKEKPELIPE